MESFISRRSHDDIVAGKDETIASKDETIALLRLQIENERASFASERETLQSLATAAVEAMKPPPLPIRRPRPEAEGPVKEPSTLDLSMVDPTDNEALVMIVKGELPPGQKVSAQSVLRAVERLRDQVIEAHKHREATSSIPAYVQAIPQHVKDRIAQAEREGAAAAVGV